MRTLFLSEAAELARVSVTTLRRAIRARQLRATKKARRWRISEGELQRWLDTSDASPPAVAPARARSASAPTEHGSVAYPWDKTPVAGAS